MTVPSEMYTKVIISKKAMQQMLGENMATIVRRQTQNTNDMASRQQAYWFKDDLNLNSNWLRGANWETDDHYDKNPITVDGNNITWSWRYECDGDDGGNGDDSDDGADKNTMVTIRTRW